MRKWASRTRGGYAYAILVVSTQDGSMEGWVDAGEGRFAVTWAADGLCLCGHPAYNLVPVRSETAREGRS